MIDNQQEESALELTQALIERATRGERTEFRLLVSAEDARNAKAVMKACKSFSRKLGEAAMAAMLKYAGGIDMSGCENVRLLISAKQVRDCAEFYREECETLKDMLREFRCYVSYGHRISMLLLGFERPEEDMTDWRELPISVI